MIRLVNVSKRYGSIFALKNINILFYRGKINVVLGPSGAGKTTLLRIIAGLEKPDRGRVFLDGEDITDLPPWRRNLALVFQETALFPHMTAWDNIAFGLEAMGYDRRSIRARIEWVSNLLHIKHLLDKYPEQLSGGEAKRIVLARALVLKPEILLLDEPFSNLDLLLREELRRELKKLQRETGVTIIHVTHDLDEALELADYIVLINNGRIIDHGDPLNLYWSPSKIETARFWKHNIVSSEWFAEQFGVDVEGGCSVVIPSFSLGVREGSRCIIEDKLFRRNYILLVVKCGDVFLDAASPYMDSMKYSVGDRVDVFLIESLEKPYTVICEEHRV